MTDGEIVIHTQRSDDLHDALCTAFLQAGGYLFVDDKWHEIVTMVPEPGGFAWILRPVRFVGAA